MRPILDAGDNCWRKLSAKRAAFVIDGEDYYRAVREAMCQARRSIFIVGWDIHSELRLVRDGHDDGHPEILGPLLDHLAHNNKQLNIYVLSWDFAMIYAIEREFFPHYKLRWKSHKRVHFCLDGKHPVGASQHQKIVVIDDAIAFSGGLDLSKWRWDTSQHAVDDERRIDPDGNPYPPFHDVQMLVEGDAAAALGELVRERWRIAADNDAVDLQPATDDTPWPASIEAPLEDIDVGIARTLPQYGDRAQVREVEQLYLDSIEAAESCIYIENQYFSSDRVGQALARRLEQADGPEIILVMPEKTGGWLEQHTMDVLRARLLKQLRESDPHDRLRVYYVRLAKDPHVSLMIHAKVMIIDDCFARVASSNISNRSMGLDSECDLALESTDRCNCDQAIADFRRELLAEHLGVDSEDLYTAEQDHDSLISAIESLTGDERSLQPLQADIPDDVDQWVPQSNLLDPEQPVEPEVFFDHIIEPKQRKPAYRHMLRIGTLLIGIIALAALWRWTSLSEWLSLDQAEVVAGWIQQSPLTPLLVLMVYVIGGLIALPVTLMIVATVSVFGPWAGTGYALLGAELSALANFGLGHMLGREAVGRFAGSRVNRISRRLSDHGVLTIITLRIVPVAPFSLINVIAGVSDIRLRDFALGSFIGMIPGVVAIALLTERILASLHEPGPVQIAILVGAALLIILALFSLRRWLVRQRHS